MLEHHAYLVRLKEVSFANAKPYIDTFGITEVIFIDVPNFGIDDVRELTFKAFMRPQLGDTQLVVVITKGITFEAQQALLKILEEPPISTAFVFCVPEALSLLPTLLSRFMKFDVFDSDVMPGNTIFDEWRAASVPERLASSAKRLAAKDSAFISAIKSGLLSFLTTNKNLAMLTDLATLYFIAEHLETRGASNKLLLEELALTLPFAAEK